MSNKFTLRDAREIKAGVRSLLGWKRCNIDVAARYDSRKSASLESAREFDGEITFDLRFWFDYDDGLHIIDEIESEAVRINCKVVEGIELDLYIRPSCNDNLWGNLTAIKTANYWRIADWTIPIAPIAKKSINVSDSKTAEKAIRAMLRGS